MSEQFPIWVQDWMYRLGPVPKLILIVVCAWLLRKVLRALIEHLRARSVLAPELVVGLRRAVSFTITTAATLLILQQLGVSATVLWTALTGFVAVAAIAFFAAWSVLSNIFCTLLIVTSRPFRINDQIELLENGEKAGLRGQVVDVNLIYTTLREVGADGRTESVLQIPNSLFFQRIVRRWRNPTPPPFAPPSP
jgi:small-conductance mechanosensitive channel